MGRNARSGLYMFKRDTLDIIALLFVAKNLGRNTRHETGDAGEVLPGVPVGCLRVGAVQHDHELVQSWFNTGRD